MFRNITLVTMVFLTVTNNSVAQTSKTNSLGSGSTAALAYFDQIQAQSFEIYLKSIRPRQISTELKTKLIAKFPKQDVVSPSGQGRDKLAALEPVLQYYGRCSVIELKVIRMDRPRVLFLAGAAVVISEKALDLLTASELQPVIAHELGHEYFWDEWQHARLNQQYSKMQEIELLCDAMAVITMNQLALDPSHYISAISKMTKSGNTELVNPGSYPNLQERIRFITVMIAMVKARGDVFGPIASKE